MSHVISAQPSATSPYQPTALQEGNGGNPPRIHRIDSEQNDDCCINTRNKKGCCLFICRPLARLCQGIAKCTESCCDYCSDSLIDCCEDKPRDRKQRIYNKRYVKSGGSYYDNTADNDDWGINSLSIIEQPEPTRDLMSNFNDNDYSRAPESVAHHSSGHHDSVTHHSSNHHDSGTHHSSNHHDSGTYHSSNHHDSGTYHSSNHHDSGTHHSSNHHDSGAHHTSSHDTSTCHTSSYDAGNSGGGCDSGGGDTGGGCDSGGGDTGGGCDSGGGCD